MRCCDGERTAPERAEQIILRFHFQQKSLHPQQRQRFGHLHSLNSVSLGASQKRKCRCRMPLGMFAVCHAQWAITHTTNLVRGTTCKTRSTPRQRNGFALLASRLTFQWLPLHLHSTLSSNAIPLQNLQDDYARKHAHQGFSVEPAFGGKILG